MQDCHACSNDTEETSSFTIKVTGNVQCESKHAFLMSGSIDVHNVSLHLDTTCDSAGS